MHRTTQTTCGAYVIALLGLGWLPDWPAAAAPGPKEKSDAKLIRELQEERVKALEEQSQGQFERVKIGKDPLIQFLTCVHELCDARLELADSPEKRRAAVEEMVKTLREAEEQMTHLQAAGLQTKQGVAQAKAARLKAEIQLERLKDGK